MTDACVIEKLRPPRRRQCTLNIAISKTVAIETLASRMKTPINTDKPRSSSINIVNHAIKCGQGTPNAWRIEVNVFHEAIPYDEAQRNWNPC